MYSICIPLYSTLWSPKKFVTLFFISQWFLQMLTNLYSIWHTVYGVNLQYLIYPPHLNTAASLPWGKLIWCLHLPARQCASTACASDRATTLKFIPADLRSQNGPDLNPVDYEMMRDRVYQMSAEDVADLLQRLIDTHCKVLSMVLLMNDIRDFRPVWMKKEATWTLSVIFRLKCTLTMCTNWIFFNFVH